MDSKNFEDLEKRFDQHILVSKDEYIALNEKIDRAVTALTTNTAASSEMLMLYDNLKKAFRVLGWVEKGAVWVTKISAACGVMWMLWKFTFMQTIEQIKNGIK